MQERIRRLAGTRAAFRYSGGDEFEWALPDAAEALDAILLLRARLAAGDGKVPPIRLRCGIGRGQVTVEPRDSPYTGDGPAFHRARAAFEAVRSSGARSRRSHQTPFEPSGATPRITAIDLGSPSPIAAALLAHMDHLQVGWTHPQAQAIALVLQGLRYEEAGEQLGISAQNVHKRLQAASFDLFLEGHAALKTWLGEET